MKILRIIQNIFLSISLIILVFLPLFAAFGEMSSVVQNVLYRISFIAVFFVMIVRPLADILPTQKWLRKLVFLRKGVGVLSASIIVGFMIGGIIAPGSTYLSSIFTVDYWSIQSGAFFAHIGDWTGLILLLTSNNLSMILLKKNWKRIQKLAYVYFYSGGIYEVYILDHQSALWAMIIVACVVVIAFIMNAKRKNQS